MSKKDFEFCQYCGELFFVEDLRRVNNGLLCVRCLERGAKIKA